MQVVSDERHLSCQKSFPSCILYRFITKRSTWPPVQNMHPKQCIVGRAQCLLWLDHVKYNMAANRESTHVNIFAQIITMLWIDVLLRMVVLAYVSICTILWNKLNFTDHITIDWLKAWIHSFASGTSDTNWCWNVHMCILVLYTISLV